MRVSAAPPSSASFARGARSHSRFLFSNAKGNSMNARPALAAVLMLTAWSIVAPAQRLSRTAIPEHYDIHLAPDFASDTFGGHVAIKVRIAATQSITLNAAEID